MYYTYICIYISVYTYIYICIYIYIYVYREYTGIVFFLLTDLALWES